MRRQRSIEEKIAALNLAAEVGVVAAASQLGIPASTLSEWKAKDAAGQIRPSEPSTSSRQPAGEQPGARELEISGLKAQLARLQQRDVDDPRSTWLQHEDRAARAIQKHQAGQLLDLKLTGDRPVGVCFVSDQHIGAKLCDLTRMREDAELIAATDGLYAILGGDGCDNHILIRSAMIASETPPEAQYELFEHYLSILGDKILCMLTGNHDHWTAKAAGIDLVGRIAAEQRIHYVKHEVLIRLTVGGQLYRVLARHGTRYHSAINSLHGLKRQWDLGNHDFDVGVAGHVHTAAIEQFYRHGVSRWAALAGSYQVSSDYSSYGGYPESVPTCPTFILWPGSRRITGFASVRDAAVMLKSIR